METPFAYNDRPAVRGRKYGVYRLPQVTDVVVRKTTVMDMNVEKIPRYTAALGSKTRVYF